MKKFLSIVFLTLLLMPLGIHRAESWGFFGHKRINHLAVFTLPPSMLVFYKPNIEWITEHAPDPDKRRYSDPEEPPRHYIDMDRYGKFPFPDLPHNWYDAVAKYGEDSLTRNGIVPWQILLEMKNLEKAFSDKNRYRILRYSADIGHYVGDGHVPLHCTENYNGQMTGQKGIHALWESRVPELFADAEYDFVVGKADYIDKPAQFVWKFILESAAEVDSVLNDEKEVSAGFSADDKFTFEDRGSTTVKTYSVNFCRAYQTKLANMQERRMRAAIYDLGCIWYTCWVNAGQPDLSGIADQKISDDDLKSLQEMDSKWIDGKIIGREEE